MSTTLTQAPEMTVAVFWAQSRIGLQDAAEMAEMPLGEFRAMINRGDGPPAQSFRFALWIALSEMNAWLRHSGHPSCAVGLDPDWGRNPRHTVAGESQ